MSVLDLPVVFTARIFSVTVQDVRFSAVNMSVFVFWVVKPRGFVDTFRIKYTDSIFSPENGSSMFLRNFGVCKFTRRYNL